MNLLAWIVQAVLAAIFLVHGFVLVNPPEAAAAIFEALPFSRSFMGFIGLTEMLGAVGLILPRALGMLPALTPLAATGLMVIMLGASGTHVTQGEFEKAIPTLVIAGLCAFVAYFRSDGLRETRWLVRKPQH